MKEDYQVQFRVMGLDKYDDQEDPMMKDVDDEVLLKFQDTAKTVQLTNQDHPLRQSFFESGKLIIAPIIKRVRQGNQWFYKVYLGHTEHSKTIPDNRPFTEAQEDYAKVVWKDILEVVKKAFPDHLSL